MKNVLFVSLIVILALVIAACGIKKGANKGDSNYLSIPAKEAKELMDSEADYIILDVRAQEEYDQGHIPKAIVIPHTEIETEAKDKLPDKDQLILVYCRTGRRSKIAAQSLAKMGYTNIKEFGGITDWPYDLEK
ncbi:MAG: rhodanese-like domain-containing protein [Clostridia bacterium]|nr:rhodanese-like domain-containing protein [Clostridia bacterium]